MLPSTPTLGPLNLHVCSIKQREKVSNNLESYILTRLPLFLQFIHQASVGNPYCMPDTILHARDTVKGKSFIQQVLSLHSRPDMILATEDLKNTINKTKILALVELTFQWG